MMIFVSCGWLCMSSLTYVYVYGFGLNICLHLVLLGLVWGVVHVMYTLHRYPVDRAYIEASVMTKTCVCAAYNKCTNMAITHFGYFRRQQKKFQR